MPPVQFYGRSAVALENEKIRITVLREGGHIAELFDKTAMVSPLWIPPWPTIEPSICDFVKYPDFGSGSDARLLAGIMGHNVCLDLFGGPSGDEWHAGISAHGEASIGTYEIGEQPDALLLELEMAIAQIHFTRSIRLHGTSVRIHEVVRNLAGTDRPIGWTQHVTLGPPFLDPMTTEFRCSVLQSVVSDSDPGLHAYLEPGTNFNWPLAPSTTGAKVDLQKMHIAPSSSYTAHLVNTEHASFTAFNPSLQVAISYAWRRSDFPWLGIWEENCSRTHSPWNARTIARGMEFGVSPFPESRREMVERGPLFGVPTFRWLPARGELSAEYWIMLQKAKRIPEAVEWPGDLQAS